MAIFLPAVVSVFTFASAGHASQWIGGSLDQGLHTAIQIPANHEIVVCESVDTDARFEVLFRVSPAGQRVTALSMMALDPNVSEDNQLIAQFDLTDGLLSNGATSNSAVVIGTIDLRNPKTGRKGERIGGTKLGALRSIMIEMQIDFTAAFSGKRHSAQATYFKRNGEERVQDLDCVRNR